MAAVPAGRWLHGGGWALLTLGLGLGLGFVRTVVAARLLGPAELGLMAIALLALGTVDAVTSTGADTALVAGAGDAETDLDAAFTLQALRGALAAAALCAAAPAAAWLLGNPQAAPVVRAVAAVALLRGLVSPGMPLLVKRMEFARIFWWSVPEALAGFALAIGAALLRRDVWALVIAAVGAQLVATAASYAAAPRRPRLGLHGAGRLLGYGKWVSGTRTLTFLSLNLDNVVVARLLGTGALGVYALAFRVAELGVVTFARAAAQVALPALSRARGDAPALAARWRGMLRLVVGVNCAFAAGVLLFAGPVVRWTLGAEWLDAVPVLRILAVAMVFRAGVVLASELFHAVRRPRLTTQVNALRLAVMLVTLLPLARAWGLRGAAVSVLLASVAAALLCAAWVRGILAGGAQVPLRGAAAPGS
jgi:PST family polysaccharide transporter/lipopolysaccharide exporter